MASTNHTHSIFIHTFSQPPGSHTHCWYSLMPILHTLTTYFLASKAYVGRPRVLFISSLWQMSARGDCCCGGRRRKHSFVNIVLKILYCIRCYLTAKAQTICFLFFLPNRTHRRAHTQILGMIRQPHEGSPGGVNIPPPCRDATSTCTTTLIP